MLDSANVPHFDAFRGLRYATAIDAADVTSPPYDVIDAAERAALAARNPANAVHVDAPTGDDGYEEAAFTLARWVTEGTLVLDERPSLTLYRMSFTDESGRARSTTGVVAALALEPPGEGDVLPHERTTPKARSDRLQLLRTTEANTSAVWGLSLAEGLSGLLDIPAEPPRSAVIDDDGVHHEVWRIDDRGPIATILGTLVSAPVVIADGHHRYETCLAYRAEQRATDHLIAESGEAAPGRQDVRAASGHDFTLAFIVELAEDQLTVAPIHRLLTGVGPAADVVRALAGHFDAEHRPGRPGPGTVDALVAAGALGLIGRDDGWWLLRPRADAPAPERDLDSARLEAALGALGDPAVAYQHGVANIVAAVDEGRADVGVLLRPATVAQIAEVAHARERMPPKTTFFWPKPRTGLVFRRFAD